MTMTVTQLKQQLEAMEAEGYGETPVYYTYNYGDHWRTTVAARINAVESALVEHSEYHNMMKVVHDEDDVDTTKATEAIVLL